LRDPAAAEAARQDNPNRLYWGGETVVVA